MHIHILVDEKIQLNYLLSNYEHQVYHHVIQVIVRLVTGGRLLFVTNGFRKTCSTEIGCFYRTRFFRSYLLMNMFDYVFVFYSELRDYSLWSFDIKILKITDK